MSFDISKQFKSLTQNDFKLSEAEYTDELFEQTNSSNEIAADFKSQSVKLLENIFNLRQNLEIIRDEYSTIVPKSGHFEVSSQCSQLETNSGILHEKCRDSLQIIHSTKYINYDISFDIKLHRESVGDMLITYLTQCEKIFDEITKIKRRIQIKKKLIEEPVHKHDDDSVAKFENDLGDGSELRYRSSTLLLSDTASLFSQEEIAKQRSHLYKKLEELSKFNNGQMSSQIGGDQVNSIIKSSEPTLLLSEDRVSALQHESLQDSTKQYSAKFWVLFLMMLLSFALILIDYLYGS